MYNITKRIFSLIFVLIFSCFSPDRGVAQTLSETIRFENKLLSEVVEKLQMETSYFFLYRESQIAGIRISLDSDHDRVLEDLRSELDTENISLQIDTERRQVLLVRKDKDQEVNRFLRVSGQVVNSETGERLPFATISWMENGEFSGVVTNSSGRFHLETMIPDFNLILKASYLGFDQREVLITKPESNSIEDLTIRLDPKLFKGREIVVTGTSTYLPSDTLLAGMIDAGRFSPLGEANSIRALQSHPSVSAGTALNDGLNVRGSTPDGFLVLLDGMTIFNQSHLFGLLDSFNADAVHSSGYYFGITPANIDTPTGGTLNLITRTGSRNENRITAGISNTSLNTTAEGPAGKKGSYLVSGRTSYMDQVNWFNNPSLIQWGLDVNRPKRLTSDEPDFTDLVLIPGRSTAQFADLHAKYYHERSGSGRFIFSGYFGGDRTSHTAQRRTRTAGTESAFSFLDVETSNQWGNTLASIRYEQELLQSLYLSTTAGVSSYETRFEKDDFVYSRISSEGDNSVFTIFTYPFRNRSSINEFKVAQEVEFQHQLINAVAGTGWTYYRGDYSESSFDRPSFFTKNDAHLANAYLQTQLNLFSDLSLNAGGRISYYSPANRFFTSPRIQLSMSPHPKLNLSAGYSRNYQFLHKVSLENATTSDVWILSTENQDPASSEQYSAGLELLPASWLYLKAEIYQKNYKNLRIHELNTQSLENTFSGTPWFFQNRGDARGVELIVRNRVNRFTFTQSYTISRMVLSNPALLDGEQFYADWDRTHSYNSVLEIDAGYGVQLNLSWLMMSGAPATNVLQPANESERIDPYRRLDATLLYEAQITNQTGLEISVSFFNLLNRQNVWYRSYSFNFDETRSIPRLRPVPVDVLDLGFQPSFSAKFTF